MSQDVRKRSIGRHACEYCRKSKIRCVTDTLETHGKCRKCHASGMECEWKEISKTRVRKRTNARVADLENRLSALTAEMNNAHQSASAASTAQCEQDRAFRSFPSTTSHDHNARATSVEGIPRANSEPQISNGQALQGTLIHHGSGALQLDSFSKQTRTELIQTFISKMLPQYPMVSVSSETQLHQLEETRPFTTNAIIAAACSISKPESFKAMHEKNISILSQAVVVNGRKSIDLLQAFLIVATWPCPPDNLSDLNVYQWSHIACTMALELGIGGMTSLHAQAQHVNEFATDPSDALMEKYRAMFGIYLMCSRLAVSFRRQRTISFSSSTDIVVELFLRNNYNINDRRLAAWLRLQLIAEDVESIKQNAEMRADVSAAETSPINNDFLLLQDRLKSWENALDPVLWTESLRIDFGLCKSKLHELTIYQSQNLHQLDLPALTISSSGLGHDQQRTINPRYIRALLSFVEGCKSILEVFLRADPQTLRVLPMLTIFRVPFAFKALAMLKRRLEDPNDALNLVIDHHTLEWDIYSNGVLKTLEKASAGGLFAFPSVALRIRDLMLKSKQSVSGGDTDDQTQGNEAPTHRREAAEAVELNFLPEEDGGFMHNLSMPFDTLQSQSSFWPTDFIGFDFHSS